MWKTPRLGLRQDVREFLRTQRRIGGHQNHPGERGAVLQNHPFRNVRSPDSDPISTVEPRQEVVRTPLCFVEKLREGPRAIGFSRPGKRMRLRRNHFSDCNQIRRVRGALSQQPTHRLLLYRVRHVSGEVRRFENTAHLTSTFYRGGVSDAGSGPPPSGILRPESRY